MTDRPDCPPSHGFWHCEAGAVTVDWVVLSAVALSIGLSGVTAVRTGTLTLAGGINHALSLGTFWQEPFAFEHLTDEEQQDSATSYAAMSDAELTRLATRQTAQFAQQLAAGELDAAARQVEQHHLLTTTLNSRGVSPAPGTPTVSEMTESLDAARGT